MWRDIDNIQNLSALRNSKMWKGAENCGKLMRIAVKYSIEENDNVLRILQSAASGEIA